MQEHFALPTVTQHLSAIRALLDYLVVGQVLPSNPAAPVRGPKHVVKHGKTPVLAPSEARTLLDSIDLSRPSGIRDRALLATMAYSFARVGAVIGMNVEDYYQQGKRWWLRLHEKGGKFHQVPAHHNAEQSTWMPTSRPQASPARRARPFGAPSPRAAPSPPTA